MDDASRFHRNHDQAVADMFRLANRDHALTINRLSLLSGIPQSTLSTWATGNTSMPAWAFWRLAPHIPNDLLTLCAELAGKVVVSGQGGGSLDEVGCEAAGFVASYVHAKADNVIDHREEHALRHHARRLRCVVGAA